MSALKIALIDDNLDRANLIQCSLLEHGLDVVACIDIAHLSTVKLEELHADVILLDMANPHRDIIENCVSQFDLPTVLFTKNTNKDVIKNAIDAGVTAYIVDGINPEKLESILEISIEQYKKYKKLVNDLEDTKSKLADRKDIEKAKAFLMQIHNISEEKSFQLLRNNAMSSRITIGEIARRLIDTQKLLQFQPKE